MLPYYSKSIATSRTNDYEDQRLSVKNQIWSPLVSICLGGFRRGAKEPMTTSRFSLALVSVPSTISLLLFVPQLPCTVKWPDHQINRIEKDAKIAKVMKNNKLNCATAPILPLYANENLKNLHTSTYFIKCAKSNLRLSYLNHAISSVKSIYPFSVRSEQERGGLRAYFCPPLVLKPTNFEMSLDSSFASWLASTVITQLGSTFVM